MKKLFLISLIVTPWAYGLVWSEDPTITEEQKEERREINKRIAENMRRMEKKQDNVHDETEQDVDDNDYS